MFLFHWHVNPSDKQGLRACMLETSQFLPQIPTKHLDFTQSCRGQCSFPVTPELQAHHDQANHDSSCSVATNPGTPTHLYLWPVHLDMQVFEGIASALDAPHHHFNMYFTMIHPTTWAFC